MSLRFQHYFIRFIIKVIVFVHFQSLFSINVGGSYICSLLLVEFNLGLLVLGSWKLTNFISFFQISFIFLESEQIFINLPFFIKKVDFRCLIFLILSSVECLKNFLLLSCHISEWIFLLVLKNNIRNLILFSFTF